MIDNDTQILREAEVFQAGILAGYLQQKREELWVFRYAQRYEGTPVSLTLPVRREPYIFNEFPAVFEGLLPEGTQLEVLPKTQKFDCGDYFKQLVTVGNDLVGSLTVHLLKDPILETKEG